MRITLCVTGDSILMQPIPPNHPEIDAIKAMIKSADVRINNLEMVLTSGGCFASAYCGGMWLLTPPYMLEELDTFGFNYYGFANNHTTDYSYGGLCNTLEIIRAKKVLVGGAGMSLEETSRPAIIETKNGRVGVIAVTTTCDDGARAGNARGSIPARPGVNMLRHKEIYTITSAQMRTLWDIARDLHINGRTDNSRRGGYISLPSGVFPLGPLMFAEGETPGKSSTSNPADMERLRRSIAAARKEADYVFVCFHSHEIRGQSDDTPDDFVEEFAHACVNGGAAAVIGTGTHQLKGVEGYKGTPILYCIGNFIFQSEAMADAPADYFERYGVDPSLPVSEVVRVRSANHTRGLEHEAVNYRAVIPWFELEEGILKRLLLYPIELGFADSACFKGYPAFAGEDVAEEIYQRLYALSVGYGTKLVRGERAIEGCF